MFTDSKSPLIIRVRKTGAYYYFRNNKHGKIRIGKVGVVALKDARIKAHEFEITIHEGKNPKNTSLNSDPTLQSIYFGFVNSDKFSEMKSRYDFRKVCEKYAIPSLLKSRYPINK